MNVFSKGTPLKLYVDISSVKPFKSKNRDKIDLDATNPNLKKGFVRFSSDSLTYKLLYGFGGKVPYSSNKILPMKFYSRCLDSRTSLIISFIGWAVARKSLSEPFFRSGFGASR